MLGLTPASKLHEVISSFGWTTISHPPYLPNLASSDFHLFGPLKESLRGRHFSSDKKVKTAVRKWLKMQPVEFYNEGICAFIKRWGKGSLKSGRLHQEITMKCSCYILSCDTQFVYL